MLQLPQILWAGSCTLFLVFLAEVVAVWDLKKRKIIIMACLHSRAEKFVKRNGACRCHTCCVCELLPNGFFGFLTEAGTTLEKRIILMTRLYTR